MGCVDAQRFERLPRSWPAEGAQVLDHRAAHRERWCIGGGEKVNEGGVLKDE